MTAVSFGHHRGRLDLDLRLRLDERADLDDGHRRIMAADQLAPGSADLLRADSISVDVGDVAGHADDMLGSGAVHGQNVEDVLERLPELAGQIGRSELLLFVPADDAGRKDGPTARRDAVRIAFGPRPAGRKQRLHGRNAFRWWRAMTIFCTSEAPS